MTRKHAIHEAEAHVVTSHGADFFGEDRHPLKSLTSLAGYAEGCLSRDERGPVVLLLTNPGEGGTMTPSQATEIAALLHKLARHRFVRAKESAVARALADAATLAADAGEPWEWRIEAA
ncbi:DUF7739 domain-containing protein [Streptomyces lavendofoliae]|uniref:DUF7739 domain-containing protein n=1 Tax=Streptomyces lavendofoliae TaxID=67314 RepID=A0A918I3P6_9ACTN|nr:hypothetical protein [Streptomyces lavendofoliae]GGU67380.1 hypothetical protein GCM10010274_64810 [Streptomyces lavendofoliae]